MSFNYLTVRWSVMTGRLSVVNQSYDMLFIIGLYTSHDRQELI